MIAIDTVAAVDIGGTKTAAALVSRTGEIVARATAPTPGRLGAAAILKTATELVHRLEVGLGPSRALGVGSAGIVDAASGLVLGATDVLSGWTGTDLRGKLAAATGRRTTVINDVHAHALGEARRGAALGARSVLFIGVGTGIGGSFVVDGNVLAGAHSAAGHVGHQPSPYATELICSCGSTGHLEAVAAGPALRAAYDGRCIAGVSDLREVGRRAADGDQTAIDIVVLGGVAVGSAIGGLLNVLDPHLVVVGGGVSGLGEWWWNALQVGVRREALSSLLDTPVVPAALGTDAALIGAAELAWEIA